MENQIKNQEPKNAEMQEVEKQMASPKKVWVKPEMTVMKILNRLGSGGDLGQYAS